MSRKYETGLPSSATIHLKVDITSAKLHSVDRPEMIIWISQKEQGVRKRRKGSTVAELANVHCLSLSTAKLPIASNEGYASSHIHQTRRRLPFEVSVRPESELITYDGVSSDPSLIPQLELITVAETDNVASK